MWQSEHKSAVLHTGEDPLEMTTTQATEHRHEFYLTSTFVGSESGQTFYVGTCSCGATESNVAR